MADPNLYAYESPLKGYEGLEPLPKYVSGKHYSYVTFQLHGTFDYDKS
jgi:hypothetical protein